jgi:hypothetical protein
MNKAIANPLTKPREKDYTRNETFQDEEYTDQSAYDNQRTRTGSTDKNALAIHLGHQKRLDPTLPPFHPDNIETEKQMRPKYAERINPLNLLSPASNSWQPQG